MSFPRSIILPILTTLAAGLQPRYAQADTIYRIGTFSPDYSATVTLVGRKQDLIRPGYTIVYDKQGTELIRVDAEELSLHMPKAKARKTKEELPYDQQDFLVYNDFNFDELYDLAILANQNACSDGPAFQVFLATPEGGFQYNHALSQLTYDRCTLFTIDRQDQHLHTQHKTGCCRYQYHTYQVQDTTLRLLEAVNLQQLSHNYTKIRRRKYKDDGVETQVRYTWRDHTQDGASSVLLSFQLQQKADRRAVVFQDDQGFLDYALLKGEDREVEFSARLAAGDHLSGSSASAAGGEADALSNMTVQFHYLPTGALGFWHRNTRYTVVDTPVSLGLRLQRGNRTRFIKGDPSTRKGGIRGLDISGYHNVEQ